MVSVDACQWPMALPGTVGVSYRLQTHWSLDAAYAVSQVKTNMAANTSGVIRRTTIDIRPSAIVLSAGYSF